LAADYTAGAGGYGSPSERTQQRLDDDVESGKFSTDFAAADYGK